MMIKVVLFHLQDLKMPGWELGIQAPTNFLCSGREEPRHSIDFEEVDIRCALSLGVDALYLS